MVFHAVNKIQQNPDCPIQPVVEAEISGPRWKVSAGVSLYNAGLSLQMSQQVLNLVLSAGIEAAELQLRQTGINGNQPKQLSGFLSVKLGSGLYLNHLLMRNQNA